jgi:hypothetical protein
VRKEIRLSAGHQWHPEDAAEINLIFLFSGSRFFFLSVIFSLSFSCFPYFLLNLTFRFPTILLPTALLDLHTVLPISDFVHVIKHTLFSFSFMFTYVHTFSACHVHVHVHMCIYFSPSRQQDAVNSFSFHVFLFFSRHLTLHMFSLCRALHLPLSCIGI